MGREMGLATTDEKVPEPILEAYRYKLDKFWPGEKKAHSDTDTDVLCSTHENDGKPHNPSLGADLRKTDDGYRIMLNCRSQGCEFGEILKGAGITSDDLVIRPEEPEGCTVEQYGRVKGFDVDYLTGDEVGLENDTYGKKPAVRVPYYDENGKYLKDHDRYRIRPQKVGDDHPMRSTSKKAGGKTTLYGRWWLPEAKEAGYVLVVEGESDCHTAWSMGWKAVGVPGIQSWRDEWSAFFEGIEKIYVVVEDRAGEKLFEKLGACEDLAPRLYKVVL